MHILAYFCDRREVRRFLLIKYWKVNKKVTWMQLPHKVLILRTPLGGGWSSGTSGVPEQKREMKCHRRIELVWKIPEGVGGADASPRPSSLSPVNSRPGVSHLIKSGARWVFVCSVISRGKAFQSFPIQTLDGTKTHSNSSERPRWQPWP